VLAIKTDCISGKTGTKADSKQAVQDMSQAGDSLTSEQSSDEAEISEVQLYHASLIRVMCNFYILPFE